MSAAPPALADAPLADELFQQGKALMKQGSIHEGCQKLAESLALKHRGGTLLNLAVCRDQEGRYTTALRLYEQALGAAVSDGREDRALLARTGIEEVRKKLSWLTVKPPPGSAPTGLTIHRDGVEVPREAWGKPEPVDAGEHTVTASAPGRAPYAARVTVGGPGAEQVAEIPLLAELASAPQPTAEAPPAPGAEAPAWRRPLVGAAFGLGAAALFTGGVFGVKAILDSQESRRLCPDTRCLTDEGYQKNQSARNAAVVADVAVPTGLAAIGVGILLLLTSRAPAPRSLALLQLTPQLAPTTAGLSLRGAW
jgi:hypothetical protein